MLRSKALLHLERLSHVFAKLIRLSVIFVFIFLVVALPYAPGSRLGLGLHAQASSSELDSVEAVEAALFRSLEQGCLLYPNSHASATRRRDWWKYKWCPFEGEIYQFHDQGGVVQVEYSLGSLPHSEAQGKSGRSGASLDIYPAGKGVALRYWYNGGQHCHETNRARRTEVTILCCNRRHRKRLPAPPFIQSAKEVGICAYAVTVCADALCIPGNVSDAGEALGRNASEPLRTLDDAEVVRLKDEVKAMFYSGYQAYMTHAYPEDQLKPITCKGAFFELTAGNMLTLIDSMDMLVILGDVDEFKRAVDLVSAHANFAVNRTVSVFESTIRILGGLLSSHLFAIDLIPGYNGRLLDHAVDLADRLLPAFDTPTSIPYGTVNLLTGVPEGETTEACTAAAGSLSLEFGMLSVLTANATYGLKARSALKALFDLRSKLGLVGRHIDVASGVWTEPTGGIGSNVDSIYEYYLKQYVLFGDDQSWEMFALLYQNVVARLRHEDTWYVEANIHAGGTARKVFNNLQAFWPGMQTTLGDVEAGSHTLNAFLNVWNDFGFTPEDFDFEHWKLLKGGSRKSYPLRPELAESTFYMHEATGDPTWLVAGRDMVRSIRSSCKTKCGFASIADVETRKQKDIMPSFFLSELCKYLFLLFDVDNPFRANNGGSYVFTTEAHLFKVTSATHKAARDLGFALPVHKPKQQAQLGEDLWGVTSMQHELLSQHQCAATDLAPWNLSKSEPYYRSENRRSYKRHYRQRPRVKQQQKKQEPQRQQSPSVFIVKSNDPEHPGEFEVHTREGGFLVIHPKQKTMVDITRLGSAYLTVFVQTHRPPYGLRLDGLRPQCHRLERTFVGHSKLFSRAYEEDLKVLEDHTKEHRYLFFEDQHKGFASECQFHVQVDDDSNHCPATSPFNRSIPFRIPCSIAVFGPSLSAAAHPPSMDKLVALGGEHALGCTLDDFLSSDCDGMWVLVSRGGCSFERKTLLAEHCGARGVLVANHRLEQLFLMNAMEQWERRNVGVILASSTYRSTCAASPFKYLRNAPVLLKPSIPTYLISLTDGENLRRLVGNTALRISMAAKTPMHDSSFDQPWAAMDQTQLVAMTGTGWGLRLSFAKKQWQLGILPDKRRTKT